MGCNAFANRNGETTATLYACKKLSATLVLRPDREDFMKFVRQLGSKNLNERAERLPALLDAFASAFFGDFMGPTEPRPKFSDGKKMWSKKMIDPDGSDVRREDFLLYIFVAPRRFSFSVFRGLSTEHTEYTERKRADRVLVGAIGARSFFRAPFFLSARIRVVRGFFVRAIRVIVVVLLWLRVRPRQVLCALCVSIL
jgi:hypothetical protein